MVSFANLERFSCGSGPGVYVNVPHYRKWIDDRTNNGGRLTLKDAGEGGGVKPHRGF